MRRKEEFISRVVEIDQPTLEKPFASLPENQRALSFTVVRVVSSGSKLLLDSARSACLRGAIQNENFDTEP